MIVYKQNNYAYTPYPAPGYEGATVKSGGCGPVCASIVIENLTGKSFPPPESAKFSMSVGARVSGGTDMRVLSNAISREFSLTVKTSNVQADLLACLKHGGVAIANVGGDRSGYKGVFSNGGHYVVVLALEGTKLCIGDPGLYAGKYNAAHRKAVTVKGDLIYAAPEVLHKDAENRSPRYYLFEEVKPTMSDKTTDNTPSTWAKDAWEKAKDAGVMDGTQPKEPLTREQFAVVLDRLGMLKK